MAGTYSEGQRNASSTRRQASPSVELPIPLVANRLARAHHLSRAARTVRRHDDGFALEVRWYVRLFVGLLLAEWVQVS